MYRLLYLHGFRNLHGIFIGKFKDFTVLTSQIQVMSGKSDFTADLGKIEIFSSNSSKIGIFCINLSQSFGGKKNQSFSIFDFLQNLLLIHKANAMFRMLFSEWC